MNWRSRHCSMMTLEAHEISIKFRVSILPGYSSIIFRTFNSFSSLPLPYYSACASDQFVCLVSAIIILFAKNKIPRCRSVFQLAWTSRVPMIHVVRSEQTDQKVFMESGEIVLSSTLLMHIQNQFR